MMRLAASLLVGAGVLIAMLAHADGIDRLYAGQDYLASSPRELGFLASGLVAIACGGWIARGAARLARPRTRPGEVAVVAVPLAVVGAVLLLSIAWAFFTGLPQVDLWLKIGAGAFFVVAFGALAAFVRVFVRAATRRGSAYSPLATEATRPPSAGWRLALALAIPAGIFTMAHGCGYPGCNDTCELLTYGASALAAVAVFTASGGRGLTLLAAALLAYAYPHCTCANAINAPWIDAIGKSPNCFAFPLLSGFFAVAGLCGILPRLATLLAWGPVAAAALFAVGHHLFDYPW